MGRMGPASGCIRKRRAGQHRDLRMPGEEIEMRIGEPLIDNWGRRHTRLRISVTDRCNSRCVYCMPERGVVFRPRGDLLTFEEIERFVRVVAGLGVRRVRLTGGEPLVREGIDRLVASLARVPGIEDLGLTTNGLLLSRWAEALARAGLQRLNISLDALDEASYCRISRREGLQQVLDGIFAAQRHGFEPIRLNAVAIRGLTEDQAIPLAAFARRHDVELRFIEFMPLDGQGGWQSYRVLRGEEIRAQLEAHFGRLIPAPRPDPSQPAVDYRFADGRGRIGFIDPFTHPSCGWCNRLRLTAAGQVRNCLFAAGEWDVRTILRGGGSDQDVASLVRACVACKKPAAGIASPTFLPPEQAMYQIGG